MTKRRRGPDSRDPRRGSDSRNQRRADKRPATRMESARSHRAGQPRGIGRPRRAGLLWIAGIVTLVALVFVALRPRTRAVSPAPDPLAGVPPAQAFLEANRLVRELHSIQAIPYYHRARVDLRSDFFDLHYYYAAALRNATLEIQTRGSRRMPVTRTAYERVRMLQESLAEFDRALALAQRPSQAVDVARARAQLLSNWGFGWDAFILYRQAQGHDSTRELAQRGDAVMQVLEHPERPTP